jgi:hypothetical protein
MAPIAAGHLAVLQNGTLRDNAVSRLNFADAEHTTSWVTSSPSGTANVDLSGYLLLTGRTGTANNPVISLTTGGRVTGGNFGSLELRANTLATLAGEVEVLNQLRVDSNLAGETLSTSHDHIIVYNDGAGGLLILIPRLLFALNPQEHITLPQMGLVGSSFQRSTNTHNRCRGCVHARRYLWRCDSAAIHSRCGLHPHGRRHERVLLQHHLLEHRYRQHAR